MIPAGACHTADTRFCYKYADRAGLPLRPRGYKLRHSCFGRALTYEH